MGRDEKVEDCIRSNMNQITNGGKTDGWGNVDLSVRYSCRVQGFCHGPCVFYELFLDGFSYTHDYVRLTSSTTTFLLHED